MKSTDAFKGSYLKAEDIKGHRVAVTIETATMEEVGQGDEKAEKPVLHFVGKDRGVVLNKTNWARIADLLGSDESDDWEGQRIVLGVERVDFQGKRVDAIRVIGVPGAAPKPEPKPKPVEDVTEEMPDDTVPF